MTCINICRILKYSCVKILFLQVLPLQKVSSGHYISEGEVVNGILPAVFQSCSCVPTAVVVHTAVGFSSRPSFCNGEIVAIGEQSFKVLCKSWVFELFVIGR